LEKSGDFSEKYFFAPFVNLILVRHSTLLTASHSASPATGKLAR
jgi:hypothetical protein